MVARGIIHLSLWPVIHVCAGPSAHHCYSIQFKLNSYRVNAIQQLSEAKMIPFLWEQVKVKQIASIMTVISATGIIFLTYFK